MSRGLWTATVVSIAFGVVLVPGGVHACELTRESSWHWTESELAAKTPSIVLSRVLREQTQPQRSFADYEMEVVEHIKGTSEVSRFWIRNTARSTAPFVEWAQPRGRAIHGKSCDLYVPFEVGRLYLIFRNSFHPRGYELIRDALDPWLVAVRRLAGTSR